MSAAADYSDRPAGRGLAGGGWGYGRYGAAGLSPAAIILIILVILLLTGNLNL